MKIFFLFLISIFFIFTGCYYDNEEQLYPNPGHAETCDTVNVGYVKNIEPLMSKYCTGCHGINALNGIDLTTFDKVKANINRITGAINFQTGFSPMPKYANKFDDCKLKIVKIWKDTNMQY